jgi:hypothetical protein
MNGTLQSTSEEKKVDGIGGSLHLTDFLRKNKMDLKLELEEYKTWYAFNKIN